MPAVLTQENVACQNIKDYCSRLVLFWQYCQ